MLLLMYGHSWGTRYNHRSESLTMCLCMLYIAVLCVAIERINIEDLEQMIRRYICGMHT
jgi:hypothetical protein